MKKFAIFGNPLVYSKSPLVHSLFSAQTQIKYFYKKILINKNFNKEIDVFFSNGGLGANVTCPFKILAYKKVNELTKRAEISGSVNTIKKLSNGSLLGDDTDGIGLIFDLRRLKIIRNNLCILLIGSGGAARSILACLLKNYKCNITITNRTFYKAKFLSRKFSILGNVNPVKLTHIDLKQYNLVINATSSEGSEVPFLISPNIFSKDVFCYDLFYGGLTESSFLKFSKKHGVLNYSDGLGMLVAQAAFSFQLWHNKFPNILNVLDVLKKQSNNR